MVRNLSEYFLGTMPIGETCKLVNRGLVKGLVKVCGQEQLP